MSEFSIAITGEGQVFQIWPSHGMEKFPRAVFYDHSAAVTAFRQAEAELGRRGLLDAEGTASALRTAKNLANPPEIDATVIMHGPIQNGTVTVRCKNGNEKTFKIHLNSLDDAAIERAFFNVNAAIALCKMPPKVS